MMGGYWWVYIHGIIQSGLETTQLLNNVARVRLRVE